MTPAPPAMYINNDGFLCTRDGFRICRVILLPGDCHLVFHDRNRERSACRGSDAVPVSIMDVLRIVTRDIDVT